MRKRLGVILALSVLVLLAIAPAATAQEGRIEGHVVRADGTGVGGVTVNVRDRNLWEVTDADGQYIFAGIGPGSYTLSLSVGNESTVISGVVVRARETTQLRTEVDWPLSFFEGLVVTAASRRAERIVDAPAAVTTLDEKAIETRAAVAELPRLLTSMPGTEVVQTGLFDFNLNTRGFNSSVNRRVMTLIDGRDPSVPANLGSMEWANTSFPLDDMFSVEMVRGPAAALYGNGAVNGVLNIRTKTPLESLGGGVRLTLGELDTGRLEGHFARKLGPDWAFKFVGGFHVSHTYAESRVTSTEYPGLPREPVDVPLDQIKTVFGGIRFDGALAAGRTLTLEAGTSYAEGQMFVSEIGRVQQRGDSEPWLRVNLNSPNWNALAYYTGRHAPNALSLASGSTIWLDGYNAAGEIQGNRRFANGAGRLVGGVAIGRQTSDSADDKGQQTIFAAPVSSNRFGLFGQADYDLTRRLKGVASLRFDNATLHDPRVSPRAALVYEVAPRHTVRFSYGSAFQTPTLAQFFIAVPIAPPLDLSPIEAALAPVLGGVPLGLGHIEALALGNAALRVETIQTWEIGYSAVLGQRVHGTVSLFRNDVEDFATALLPQIGTSLGRLNPSYGPYQPPASLSPAAASALVSALRAALPPEIFASLSNNADGSPILALLSLRNYGHVTSTGVELAMDMAVRRDLTLGASYTFNDFTVQEQAAESPLLPNTPRHRVSGNVAYNSAHFQATLGYRWSDAFIWSGGIYNGPVPSYGVADVGASYPLSKQVRLGVDVTNLLDNRHYEMFGGDLLRRRALAHLTYDWQ